MDELTGSFRRGKAFLEVAEVRRRGIAKSLFESIYEAFCADTAKGAAKTIEGNALHVEPREIDELRTEVKELFLELLEHPMVPKTFKQHLQGDEYPTHSK